MLTPLPVDALLASVPARFRGTVAGRVQRGGVLTAKSSAAVIEALLKLQPDAERALERLLGVPLRNVAPTDK